MVRRLGLLTGIAAVLLALARLDRLLQPQEQGPAWQVVLVAAAVLGAVFTWTALAYRLSRYVVVAINLVGAVLAALRVAAPTTLALGVIPTPATIDEAGRELSYALELIRYGAAPVLPVAGLVAVLAVVYWGSGALLAHGFSTGRVLETAGPGLLFYLQLATLDRRPPGGGWILAFALVAGAALVALGASADPRTGRLRDQAGRLVPRRSAGVPGALLVMMLAGTLFASNALAETVPESGLLAWRTRSGIGSGLYGGSSYNLFVGMQQNLVDLSDEPVFYARVSEGAPPASQLYWRLITLDTYDGQFWVHGDMPVSRGGDPTWESEELAFQGPTIPISARVRVADLREQLLPVIYSPTTLQSPVDLIDDSFGVIADGSVRIDVRTREGWEYEFQASVPQPDMSRLASVGGQLSPIFQEAADAGVFEGSASDPQFTPRPDAIERYREIPAGLDPAVGETARLVTGPGLTRFEKALILESWFRDPEVFSYSVDVSTGHSSLDLAAWLTDPESRNFRTGYCEQFATAYALMARTLGLPSRVVLGFAPGDVQTQDDGSELIVVRDRNAHAWVEVWMDGQGWVRFDPTPRGDGINPSLSQGVGFDPRAYVPAPGEPSVEGTPLGVPSDQPGFGAEIDLTAGDITPDLFGARGGFSMPTWGWVVLGMAAVVWLLPVFKLVRRRRRLGRIRTGDVTAAWEEIVDRLRDLGAPVHGHLTPVEIARSQHADLVPLAIMYSAVAYGGKPRGDGRTAFTKAEAVISSRYETAHRAYAWFSPASLRRD